MDFISQYLLANSGTAVPRRFHLWTGLSILAMTVGRKVYVDHGHFELFPAWHTCLVGDPSIKKSTAMVAGRTMFMSCFPEYPIGSSITSREDIIKFMASDKCLKSYIDHNNDTVYWRPFANFINELSNFLSFNPGNMIEFLTDMFDTKQFKSSTIVRGSEEIINPYLTILACTVPDKLIPYFKNNIMGGGFSRRILFVYEDILPDKITFASKSSESRVAEEWCKQHLLRVASLAGPVQWTQEARDHLDKWNLSIPRNVGNVLSGYYESKDILAQKIAMCLIAADEKPILLFTKDKIETAIALLESNEGNLHKLTIAAGRNPFALYSHRLVELVQKQPNEIMPEFVWHKAAGENLTEMEYSNVKKMLRETKQLFTQNLNLGLGPMEYIMTENGREGLKSKGVIK